MRRASKVDTFHAQVRDLFRAHGCEWQDLSSVGGGVPDGLACWQGRMMLVEIKSGVKAKTKPETAARQAAFAVRFPVWRIATMHEATGAILTLKWQEAKDAPLQS